MTDEAIIELFWRRDEAAIEQTDRLYGAMCRTIGMRILRSREDVEECVSDSYFRLWQRIPPDRPVSMAAYLSRIVRSVCIDRWRALGAQKRGSELTASLEELGQVSGGEDAESLCAARELGRAVDRFLRTLPERHCSVFLRRYFYLETRSEIAQRYDMSPAQVSVSLSRTRKKLSQYLKQEGFL